MTTTLLTSNFISASTTPGTAPSAPLAGAPPRKIAHLGLIADDGDARDVPVYLKDLRNEPEGAPSSLVAANAAASSVNAPLSGGMDESQNEFVLFASLDMLEEKRWQTNTSYLGVVETFRESKVYAHVGAGGIKILLLLRGVNATELGIKSFLKAVHELWLRLSLNPLRGRTDPICDPAFEQRIVMYAQKWLSLSS